MVNTMKILVCMACLALPVVGAVPAASDYYEVLTYELPPGLAMEAAGLAPMPDGRLAVGVRRGEVWVLEHPEARPPTAEAVGYKRFATGLHELLGLAWRDGALYATQRSEVTRLRDTDGDGVADEYLAFAAGWGVSGNYHEYAYGPAFDAAGAAYTTLNSTLGAKWPGAGVAAKETPWRGWCMRTLPGGRPEPWCGGFRSPCGIGSNAAGDVFVTDQQGNWFGTNPLLHVRRGAFFGHGDSVRDTRRAESPVRDPGKLPEGITVAEAVEKVPGYCLPAVWFPYVKMGQSPTGLRADETGGRFGPFGGQLFVGEFVLSGVNRVFLEKVDGEYQGACFPFVSGLQSAVLGMAFLADGSLVVGQSNRGWNSYGNRSFGLQRLVWTGRKPFELERVEALHEGFRLRFTGPVAAASFHGVQGFEGQSYTYLYHSKYGSPETDARPLEFTGAELSEDRREVVLRVGQLRAGYVHELRLPEWKSEDGAGLWHREAYYTLNRIPAR
jgi:glucose/arabinose dehydrogenase